MTAQLPDLFAYRGEEYSLAGISEGELFDPGQLGLEAMGCATACYRGYQATFGIRDEHLVLERLRIGLSFTEERKPAVGPQIYGVAPVMDEKNIYGLYNDYPELAHPLDYSGGLLIARGFIRRMYVHMGFHPAWKYQQVFELVFDAGRLVSESDKSAQMQAVREQLAAAREGRGSQSQDEIAAFVERAFDRSY